MIFFFCNFGVFGSRILRVTLHQSGARGVIPFVCYCMLVQVLLRYVFSLPILLFFTAIGLTFGSLVLSFV